jgi:hypothetical protein
MQTVLPRGEVMYEEVCYKKSFLKAVVGRIDFVAPLSGIEKTLPTKLGKVFSDRFPIAEPTETFMQEFKFQLNPAGGDLHQQRTPTRVWNFFGKEREKKLSLGAGFTFIEYTTYSTYDDLRNDLGAVISAIDSLFPDTRAARLVCGTLTTSCSKGLTRLTDGMTTFRRLFSACRRFLVRRNLQDLFK